MRDRVPETVVSNTKKWLPPTDFLEYLIVLPKRTETLTKAQISTKRTNPKFQERIDAPFEARSKKSKDVDKPSNTTTNNSTEEKYNSKQPEEEKGPKKAILNKWKKYTLLHEKKDLKKKGQNQPLWCKSGFAVREVIKDNEPFDENAVKRHPNLPSFLLTANNFSSSIPEIGNIRWSGIVYQESWKESPKFLLYSAHFDSRLKSGVAVWIISMYDGASEPNKSELYCQMYFSKDENPVLTPVVDISFLFYTTLNKDILKPYGLQCMVPVIENSSSIPIAVSLVKTRTCQTPSNVLKISGSPLRRNSLSRINKLRKDLTIGICGKALFYYNNDFSIRLIEWIEVMRELGVSKIFLYKMPCHKNLEKVLDYYEKSGFVNLTTFYYPPPYVQDGTFVRIWTKIQIYQAWAAQSVYINDCLLKNKDSFDYLGVFDCDEVPILRSHNNIQNFIKFIIRENEGIEVRDYFLHWKVMYAELNPGPAAKNIPEKYYIMHHNRRTLLDGNETKDIETNGKTIYDTDHVLFAQCHSPLSFTSNSTSDVKQFHVNRSVAYTAHYGDHKCSPSECNVTFLEEENTLLKLKDKVIARVDEVCSLLGLN